MSSVDLSQPRSVVVGIDGSANSYLATEWAAKLAATTASKLTIVMVAPEILVPRKSQVWKAMLEPDYVQTQRDRFNARLNKAADGARKLYPGVEIETILLEGDVAGRLVEISGHCEAMVLGKRGAGQAGIFTLGGVADVVVANAKSIVVTIPHDYICQDGPVVVGIDDDERAKSTVRYGFEQARRLQVPLVVTHAWYAPPAASEATMVVMVDADEINEEGHELIKGIVDSISPDFPEVQVHAKVVNSNPADALIAESKKASMIVVASRGRGGFTGLLLGSTSRRVVRMASCPTAVLRFHK